MRITGKNTLLAKSAVIQSPKHRLQSDTAEIKPVLLNKDLSEVANTRCQHLSKDLELKVTLSYDSVTNNQDKKVSVEKMIKDNGATAEDSTNNEKENLERQKDLKPKVLKVPRCIIVCFPL